MKIVVVCLLLIFTCVGWSGCNGSKGAASVPVERADTQPQPKLPTIKLWLGAEEMIVEQALRQHEITKGMMFRKTMAENEGMLFVMPAPHRAAFWMRNCSLPLSCAYIDSAGIILEIHAMKPFDEAPIHASSDKVQYVLETNQGWFDRHKIGVGTLVRTERGTLAQTYFGK